MSDETRPAFGEEVRQAAAAFLRSHVAEIREHWRDRLMAALSGVPGRSRNQVIDGLLSFLPHFCDMVEGVRREAALATLSALAAQTYNNEVQYLRLSRGLRLLKRVLMRLVVALQPAGADRDLVCDLVEEEIDESRVRVNHFYYTIHEQLLRDSASLTRFLLNNTSDAIFLIDAELGEIVLCNAIAVQMTGYPQEELIGLRFTELIARPRVAEADEILRRSLVAGTGRLDDLPLHTRQAGTIVTQVQFVLVPQDGDNALLQASVRDTSQESAALAAQEKEAAYLRAFVTDTADGVLTVDLEGRIRSWNKGAEQVYGYKADEILNRHNRVLLPPENREGGELEALEEILQRKGYIRNFESVGLTRDGRRIDVEVTRTAIFDPATGQRSGTSVVLRDVSDKRRLEREAARKTQQLESMNRILEATSRIVDRDQTFRTIAAQMEGLLPCDALTVCLPEAEADRLLCRVLRGDQGLVVGSEQLVARDDSLHGRVFASQRSLLVAELSDLPRPGADDRRLADLGFRSALLSPLVYNNEVLGVLMLLHHEPNVYDESDRDHLDHLANHFAVILENARRFEEERKRSAQFELISRVGAAAIANIGDVKRLMRSVVDTIQTDFGYYDVALYEVDEDANAFRLKAQAGHRRGALGEGYEQPLDVGVFGEVLRTQSSCVINDVRQDPLYFDPAPTDGNVRSELAVPIRLGPRVFGVLDVESQRPNRFDRLDRAAMEALAGLLARCMEADESLRQTRMLQAMRHNIMEAVPSALILLDDELRVKFVNRRYCEFFQQTVESIMNRHAEEVFPPSLLEESRFVALVRRLKETLKPIDTREVRYWDFTGAERYADVRLRIVTEYETTIVVMLHDATNRLKRIYQLSMLQDIGEEMQRTLDTDRLLGAILTCVTAGPGFGFNRAALFLFDTDGARLTERMKVGPQSAEQAGAIWHQLGHKKTLREFLREYDRDRDDPSTPPPLPNDPRVIEFSPRDERLRRWRAPLMLRADDEESLPVAQALLRYSGAGEALVVPLVSQDELLGLIVADNLFTAEPISRESIRMLSTFASQAGVALANAQAFERLEESLDQLRQAQDQLRHAERLAGIGSVAAHVAHEIRNPLVSIGGFARRLQERTTDPDYVGSRAAVIYKEVQRLEKILKNVADFTAPQTPKLAATRVDAVVRDVLSTQQPFLEENRITIVGQSEPGLPDVMADADKLKQVIINLVRNAVQATGPGGQVELTVRRSATGVEITVRDNGPGIAAERLEEIFNPFFTNKADGTGLGLAVSRKIVADHGGVLTVQSEEGAGAAFTIALPLSGTARPDGEERTHAKPHPDR